VERPSQTVEQLCQGLELPLTQAALVSACADRLAACLESLVDWADQAWKVGDYNQCVLTATLDEGFEALLSFSCEPLEDIRWSVAATAIDRGRRELMARFGFTLAGHGGCWERDVRVASPRDAAATAQDVLALLLDGFGYSGRSPLTVTLTRGRRAEAGLLYRTLSPDDLRKLLHGWGYRAELTTTTAGNPVVRTGAGGYKFHILFAWPAKDGRMFGCINFVTVFTARHGLTLAVVNEISRSSRFSRLYLDEDGDLILERDVSLSGGVTTDFIHECLLDWTCMMESVLKKVDKLVTPPLVMH
jgi:hypothetical protein